MKDVSDGQGVAHPGSRGCKVCLERKLACFLKDKQWKQQQEVNEVGKLECYRGKKGISKNSLYIAKSLVSMLGCSIPVDKGSEIQIRQCRNMRHSRYTYPFSHHSATPHKYAAYASCLRSNSCQNKKAFQEHPSSVLSWYLDLHANQASYRPNFLAFHICSGSAGSTFDQAEKTEKPLPLYKCPVWSSLLFYG